MTSKNSKLQKNVMLEIFSGPMAGTVFQLGNVVVIGRRENSNIPAEIPYISLKDGRVSRQHANIFANKDRYFLEDLNSTNGTYLNTREIEPQKPIEIRNEDNIRMGETYMRFFTISSSVGTSLDRNSSSSPWQSEIGLNEQMIDLSVKNNSTDN